jgi:hydroxylaminobenzene mutase
MQTSIDLRLARHGVIVLLLGLLTGFVIGNFNNRALGDAAHLTGLIGGFGMIALGLLWPRLNLGSLLSDAGAWMTAASMYLNWLGLAFRGGLGSGPGATNPPLLGSPQVWDRVSGLILTAAVVVSLLSTLIVLYGLRKLAPTAAPQGTVAATSPARVTS